MSQEDNNRPRAEFITGAVLIGGIKLAYDLGKDAYKLAGTKEKIFVQLLGSMSGSLEHVIRFRLANVYLHAVDIEGFVLKGANGGLNSPLECYPIRESLGFDTATLGSGKATTIDAKSLPFCLRPGEHVDLNFRISSDMLSRALVRGKGIAIECLFGALDNGEDPQVYPFTCRLRLG